MSIYDNGLDANAANFVPLTPVSFVERSAEVFGDLPAVVHGARALLPGPRRASAAQGSRRRCARSASARQQTVTVMLTNTPEMVEAHYAVPALNAVLNTLNTRLDAPLLAWQMNHCETAVLITDREFAPVMSEALRLLKAEHGRVPIVIDVCDSEYAGAGEPGTSVRTSTRHCSRRTNRWRGSTARPTSGMRSPSATPAAPPATPRAWSHTTAAPT